MRQPRTAAWQRMSIWLAVEAHVPAQRPMLKRTGAPCRLRPSEAVRRDGCCHQPGVCLSGRCDLRLRRGQIAVDIQYHDIGVTGQLGQRGAGIDDDARRIGSQVLPRRRNWAGGGVDYTRSPQVRSLRRFAHHHISASHCQQPSAVSARASIAQIQYPNASHITPGSPSTPAGPDRTDAAVRPPG